MAQVSTYTNPSEKKEERPFLAKSNPQYKEMMKELYHWFRTSEMINYCSSCHSILSRSAISMHKNCVKYSKMKILGKEILSILLHKQFLGSNKKKTEENLLKRAKNFINSRGELRSLFFYQLLQQAEKTQTKRAFNLQINEKSQDDTMEIEEPIENMAQFHGRSSMTTSHNRVTDSSFSMIVAELKGLRREVRDEIFQVKQSIGQIRNEVDGLFHKVSYGTKTRGGNKGQRRGNGRGRIGQRTQSRRNASQQNIEDSFSSESFEEEESKGEILTSITLFIKLINSKMKIVSFRPILRIPL